MPLTGYLEWLEQRGYPDRESVPLTRRPQLYDEWFRWRCRTGNPPDKERFTRGGHYIERPDPSGNRARARTQPSSTGTKVA